LHLLLSTFQPCRLDLSPGNPPGAIPGFQEVKGDPQTSSVAKVSYQVGKHTCRRVRRARLSDDLVNNLRDKRPLTGISAQESAVVEFGQEYFRTRRVSQAAFDAALSEFGVRGLAELTSLMGYYALLAFNINAFEMLPEGGEEALLPV